jgi:hypothetical protein
MQVLFQPGQTGRIVHQIGNREIQHRNRRVVQVFPSV